MGNFLILQTEEKKWEAFFISKDQHIFYKTSEDEIHWSKGQMVSSIKFFGLIDTAISKNINYRLESLEPDLKGLDEALVKKIKSKLK